MPIAFTAEQDIEAPPETVWSALTNWERAHLWMNHVDWIRADGDTKAGTALRFHARGKTRPSSIAECTEGRLIVLRSTQGPVTADYRYTLEPRGAKRTRVRLEAQCATRGILLFLAGPLLRLAVRKSDSGQIKALKRMIEAEP